MKLIQLSKHSEPKPYILKANYNSETKATYFNSKEKLIKSPQTQVLSYCVANGYEDIYDFEKDTIIKNFINALTDDEYEDLHKDIVEYNYGKTYDLPKSLEITHDNETFDLQVDTEDIKTLLYQLPPTEVGGLFLSSVVKRLKADSLPKDSVLRPYTFYTLE